MTPKDVCFFVVGGGLPVAQKQPSAQKKPLRQQDKMAHNPLDSTSPLVKKGKQREVPKLKKPTALKKASGPRCVYVFVCLFVFSGRMLIVFSLSSPPGDSEREGGEEAEAPAGREGLAARARLPAWHRCR